jgi:hypothetical protein
MEQAVSVLSAKALLTPAAPHEEAVAALGGSSTLSEEEKFERLVALAETYAHVFGLELESYTCITNAFYS